MKQSKTDEFSQLESVLKQLDRVIRTRKTCVYCKLIAGKASWSFDLDTCRDAIRHTKDHDHLTNHPKCSHPGCTYHEVVTLEIARSALVVSKTATPKQAKDIAQEWIHFVATRTDSPEGLSVKDARGEPFGSAFVEIRKKRAMVHLVTDVGYGLDIERPFSVEIYAKMIETNLESVAKWVGAKWGNLSWLAQADLEFQTKPVRKR